MTDRLGDIEARAESQSPLASAGDHGAVVLARAARKKGKPAVVPEAPKSFPAGVMAGDAEPKRAVLWTKYVGKKRLSVRIWRIDTVTIKGKEHEKFVLIKEEKCHHPKDGPFVHSRPGTCGSARALRDRTRAAR